jgi:drug/metabolite transporter (DMT)-like permease
MEFFGIIIGLAAATIQSVSYLYSRAYSVKRHTQSTLPLLLISHTMMGVTSVALLPVFWTPTVESPAVYAGPLAGACLFYLVGQAAFFFALKAADASRVSPLLSLKIITVALLSIAIGRTTEPLTVNQWAAVGLSTGAAFAFSYTGRRLHAQAIVAMLLTISMYAAADLFIIDLVNAVRSNTDAAPTLADSCRAAILCYVFCGAVAAALLPFAKSHSPKDWTAALPFTVTWYVSMYLLFACLAWTGPVLGNITLATRGLFSIMLGVIIARAGHHHLEQHAPTSIIVRRSIAAVAMIASIALYFKDTQ